jgi:hypothetical protein
MTEKNGKFVINEPTVVHDHIDGETVILNLDTGNYYGVGDVGADIWDLVVRGKAADDIISGIQEKYLCSAGEEETIYSFLKQLQEEGLIIACDDKKGIATPQAFAVENAAQREKLGFRPPVLNKYWDMQASLLREPIPEFKVDGWPLGKIGH